MFRKHQGDRGLSRLSDQGCAERPEGAPKEGDQREMKHPAPSHHTPYQPPQRQDIVLDTAGNTMKACLDELVARLAAERRIRCWG